MAKLLPTTCLLGLTASTQLPLRTTALRGDGRARQLGFFHSLDVDAHDYLHDVGHDVKKVAVGAAHLAKATALAPLHEAEAAGDLVTGHLAAAKKRAEEALGPTKAVVGAAVGAVKTAGKGVLDVGKAEVGGAKIRVIA